MEVCKSSGEVSDSDLERYDVCCTSVVVELFIFNDHYCPSAGGVDEASESRGCR